MGLFSKNLRHISPEEKKIFEDECFNDSLIGPQNKNQELFEGFSYSDGPEDDEDDSNFVEIASKSVPDSDGFLTDITMYRDIETGDYVFVLGDKDLYSPEDGNFEWTSDTENRAWDWFNSYTGFDDEEELAEDNKDEISPEAEVILSTYNRYQLIEITEDDETYYIIMAPDGSVMTEDFYAWAESEGLDFDSLATSDKVARFADYVDSIKQQSTKVTLQSITHLDSEGFPRMETLEERVVNND